tara:strand:+ start:983 stop:1249 length:267 start_codon:yes stop_codon:yes gene_type:complete
MPKIRHRQVYSSLVFDGKELRSLIANSISSGLDNGQVLPRYVDVTNVSFDFTTKECAIEFSLDYADIQRTQPSPQDEDEFGEEAPSDF